MARLVQRLGLTRYEADEFYKKALAAYEKRQFDEALINLTDAIEILPTNAEYYAARGFIYLEDDITDKATADFQQALKLYAYEMLAHYGLGVLAFKDKRWEEAQKHFTQAYYANPKRPETLYYLSLTHHRKGEHQHALHLMRQAHPLFEEKNDKRKGDAQKWIRTLEKLAG